MREQSTRLSLSAGSTEWAARALGGLSKKRESAAKAVGRTDFSIDRGASLLSDLYVGAVEQ